MLPKSTKLGNDKGFTLIELLIAMSIIGILTAIAIPQFTAYKQRGYDSDTKTELHHLFASCKAYWGDTLSSNNCTLAQTTQASYGFVQSTDLTLAINNGIEGSFQAQGSHNSSTNTFLIDSSGNILP